MRWDFRLSISLSLLAFVLCDEETENQTTEEPHRLKLLCSQCMCFTVGHETMLVDCDNLNFDKMPEIRHEIRAKWMLEMDGNSLKNISAFPYYENLTRISFRFNEISSIADSAFANLTNLQKLDLSHNNISSASLNSKTFRGNHEENSLYPLKCLKMLNLSHNHLRGLPENVFAHLTNLTTLDLCHNPFKDFSYNTASTFTDLTSLEDLDLSYTGLRRLPDHFFAELHMLKSLDLSGNLFIVVPPEVNFVAYLKTLKINDNIFGILGRNSFWKEMNGLETLHLSGSSTLFKIEEGAFGNLTGLKTLWLNDNVQLSMLHSRAFFDTTNYTIGLKNLYIQDNALTTLSDGSLNWFSLNEIDLQRNPWSCDCNFEWIAKRLVPNITNSHNHLAINIRCNEPSVVQGFRVTDARVLSLEFVCIVHDSKPEHSFILIATIVVGCLLLGTGVVFFMYILFKKANPSDWIGENVKYRRAESDDENVSTILY